MTSKRNFSLNFLKMKNLGNDLKSFPKFYLNIDDSNIYLRI